MIAIYQTSAQAAFGITAGSSEWQLLVLWIILMTEYPKAWEALIRAQDSDISESDRKLLDSPPIARIIDGEALGGAVNLDAEAIAMLRRLTPVI